MKKNLTLLLGFLMLNIAAICQITIVGSDMPRANDTARVSVSTGNVNVAQTGPDFRWNFSNVTITSQDVIKYIPPSQTSYGLFFAQASYGIPEQNFSISSFLLQNPVGFYRNNNTASVFMGRGANVQGIPVPVNYNPRDTIYRFPLTFGKKDSSNFAANSNLLLANIYTTGKRVNEVDGWGKITTPNGTYDCIRVKSTVQQTDSVVLSGFGIPLPNNFVEYKWLAKGIPYPVFQVVTSGVGGQTITFYDKFRPELFVNNARFSASRTISQIGDTINFTDQSLGNPISWQWNITPSTFSFVGSTSATSKNPKVVFNNIGNYTVTLRATGPSGNNTVTKPNYIYVWPTNVQNIAAIAKDIVLQPNPTKDLLYISSNKNIGKLFFNVYDIVGKLHELAINKINDYSYTINTEKLPSGIYFVTLSNGIESVSKKFIKE